MKVCFFLDAEVRLGVVDVTQEENCKDRIVGKIIVKISRMNNFPSPSSMQKSLLPDNSFSRS